MFTDTISRLWNVFCSEDNMNTFLNENWREPLRDLTPPVSEAIAQIVERILTNIYQLVPFDDAFPETV